MKGKGLQDRDPPAPHPQKFLEGIIFCYIHQDLHERPSKNRNIGTHPLSKIKGFAKKFLQKILKYQGVNCKKCMKFK